MKKLKVTVNNKVYEVLVEIEGETGSSVVAPAPSPAPVASAPVVASAPIAAAVSTPAPKPAASAPADGSAVVAPLAAKVVDVAVKVGASVNEGDQVATLEAMKMNTYVFAHKSGTVSAINVSVGDGVEEGQALLTIG